MLNYLDFSDIQRLSVQGGSNTILYSATYHDQQVVVKVEDKNADPARFDQSLNILQKTSHLTPHIVDFIGWGNNWEGNSRFIVIEKLYPLPKSISTEQLQAFADIVLETSYLLYQHGLNWVASKKHLMVNKADVLKLIDFNDDNGKEPSFFHRKEKAYDVISLIEELCHTYNSPAHVLDNALYNFFKKHYQNLQNVHQPVYFNKFRNFLRTESEKGDPNYGKLVPANRKCTDRGEMLTKINFQRRSYLDIGCNVGWFCFYAIDRGTSKAVGVDIDPEKIKFNRILADYVSSPAIFVQGDITTESARELNSFDIISLFSILHLYFIQHNVSKDYWEELIQNISRKTNEVLIIETSPVIFQYLDISNWEEFKNLIIQLGEFRSAEEIGISDTNSHRPVLVFRK